VRRPSCASRTSGSRAARSASPTASTPGARTSMAACAGWSRPATTA